MTETSLRPALAVTRAPRHTLQDHVFRQLCELILNGEIAPGQLITIQTLANAFGVSAMPVREALQRLTAARALTVISGRSIGIPPLTRERLSGLAPSTSRSGIPRGDVGDTQHRGCRNRSVAGVHSEYGRGGAEWRPQTIPAPKPRPSILRYIGAAGSDALFAIIENLWLQISPYFHLLHASGNYFKANEQHELMLDAIRTRDGAAVSLGVRNDIEAAYQVLMSLLNAEGSTP